MLRSQGVVLVVQRVSHFCWAERLGSLTTLRIMATGGGIEDIVMCGWAYRDSELVTSKKCCVGALGKVSSETERGSQTARR